MTPKYAELNVPPPEKEIFIRLKTRARELDAAAREQLQREIAGGMKLCRFRALWQELSREEALEMAGGSRNVRALLEGCSGAVIFIVTGGAAIVEAARAALKSGNSFRGAVLDATGSESVEAAADALENHLRQLYARKGVALGVRRYSPGYGDWGLSAQRDFFARLKPENIGVTLSQTLIMAPEKTITAIIGLVS